MKKEQKKKRTLKKETHTLKTPTEYFVWNINMSSDFCAIFVAAAAVAVVVAAVCCSLLWITHVTDAGTKNEDKKWVYFFYFFFAVQCHNTEESINKRRYK